MSYYSQKNKFYIILYVLDDLKIFNLLVWLYETYTVFQIVAVGAGVAAVDATAGALPLLPLPSHLPLHLRYKELESS